MKNDFLLEPKRVSEVLFTKANLISPAICYGRKSHVNGVDEDFILSFFLHCSDEQIRSINSLIDFGQHDVMLRFFQGENKLTWEEKKVFDFSTPWIAKKMSPTWDNKRDVSVSVIGVFFS